MCCHDALFLRSLALLVSYNKQKLKTLESSFRCGCCIFRGSERKNAQRVRHEHIWCVYGWYESECRCLNSVEGPIKTQAHKKKLIFCRSIYGWQSHFVRFFHLNNKKYLFFSWMINVCCLINTMMCVIGVASRKHETQTTENPQEWNCKTFISYIL